MDENRKNIVVVVLGDIGRSPRMQYHSLSLAEHGHKVDIVGYKETKPLSQLESAPLVSLHYLLPYPNVPLPRLMNYLFKTLWQIVTLLFVLLIIRKPHFVLVQNPPAVPALLVCWFYSFVYSAKYIIDWHNYAYSIMSLTNGPNHPLVKLTKKIEQFCGSRASANFCVTKAMKDDLMIWINIKATVLYDRPPDIFKPISLKEKHEFFSRISTVYNNFSSEIDFLTAFTEADELGNIKQNSKRPGLIISSTSWTEDEDFSVLFSALQSYENSCNENSNLPTLVCIITGKGPLKAFYKNKIATNNFKKVTFIMPWLEFQDYSLMLASADLGVCLHKSSSGFDLPMKVVDMFGCGLPVCAIEFACINELVVDGKNGFTFKSSDDLSKIFINWFTDFPNSPKQKELNYKFKLELETFQQLRWKENWDQTVYHVFN
ncbi:chitobiosyldiphosphodolichol beta-mannosyltransferase [Agrilus planipennis]|uniref:Beta-1,4-mannosyltransferase n=1 Tax=Agrilus planipennis TaxID=224129 RepID=A0A1W4WZ97_AGRPL|nr:chitobiosyldiphosphodolichol beta-mannosyltransferase [Agrilus planipennis]